MKYPDKVLAFNPLSPDTEFREIHTNWKTVDEFWTATDVGPLMTGEIWKDTVKNRELITEIIEQKKALKKVENEIKTRIHAIMNLKEK